MMMKRLTLTAALTLGMAFAANATTETRLMDGCVYVPIANTGGTAWQRLDPNCNRWQPGNGPRAVRETLDQEAPEDDPGADPEDPKDEGPADDPKDCPPKDDAPDTPPKEQPVKPGGGHGDKRHEHSAPPGLKR